MYLSVKFPFLRLLLFLSDLKSTILFTSTPADCAINPIIENITKPNQQNNVKIIYKYLFSLLIYNLKLVKNCTFAKKRLWKEKQHKKSAYIHIVQRKLNIYKLSFWIKGHIYYNNKLIQLYCSLCAIKNVSMYNYNIKW